MKKFLIWSMVILASVAFYYLICSYWWEMSLEEIGMMTLILGTIFVAAVIMAIIAGAIIAVAAIVIICLLWLTVMAFIWFILGVCYGNTYLAEKLQIRPLAMFSIILAIIGAMLFMLLW